MNDCKLQLQQFVTEWELMVCPSSVAVSELEIGIKSPEVLLQEIIHHMESECKQNHIHPNPNPIRDDFYYYYYYCHISSLD